MTSGRVLSLLAAACCLLQGGRAWARATNPAQPRASSIGRGQPTRINVNFRVEIEGEAADAAAAEKARKALYGQAARECTVLTASFSGTACTLENLNIMFQRDNSMNRNSSVLSGNAVYQLRAD